MAYTKQTWENGISKLNADRLNHIEDGIKTNNDIALATAELVDNLPKSLSLTSLDTTRFNQTYLLSAYASDSKTYTDLDLFYNTYDKIKGVYDAVIYITNPSNGGLVELHKGEYVFRKVGCETRIDADGNPYITHITYQTELSEYSDRQITLALRLTKSEGSIYLEPRYYLSPDENDTVNLYSEQTITGTKTFTSDIKVGSDRNLVYIGQSNGKFVIADSQRVGFTYTTPGLPIIETYSPLGNAEYDLRDFATTTYVDDGLQNVREVAEGKTNSFVLSYSVTGLDREASASFYYKADGTAFTSWEEIDEYIGGFPLSGGCGNPRFNNQANEINIYDKYLITSERRIIVPYNGDVKQGDNIFVIETDVPDRWIGMQMSAVFAYKLETQKVDLTSFATTNYVNGEIADINAQINNVVEVAEGKNKSLVITATMYRNVPTRDNFQPYDWYRVDGSMIETFDDFVSYVTRGDYPEYDLACINDAILNGNNISALGMAGYNYIVNYDDMNHVVMPAWYIAENFKVGDIILITETNVPDWWISADSGSADVSFSKLETTKVDLSNYASKTYVDSKLGIWVPTGAPISTTITSAKGKSWECQYQTLKNTLTNKLKVEYTLYSLTEETADAELISFSLLTTVTIGATYVTDTIGYANLPKPIEGDTYWTFDSFTFDEATDVGNQCTILPFRGSGGFETRIFVIDNEPPAQITFKKVIANISLYQK